MDNLNPSDFFTMVTELQKQPKAKRLEWLQKQQNFLEDGRDLLEVLPLLAKSERLRFVQAHADKMVLGYDLVYVLHTLGIEERLRCAEHFVSKIENGIHLAGVLHELPMDTRAEYLGKHLDKIQTSAELSWILDLFSQEEMMDVAAHYDLLKTPQDTEIFLEKLSPEHAVEFLKKHPQLFNEGSTLALILKILPKTQRLDFAQAHQDKIKDIQALSFVLYQLPSHHRFGFIQDNPLELGDKDIAPLMRTLAPARRLEFLLMHQHQLKTQEQIVQVLNMLPDKFCKEDQLPKSKIWRQGLMSRHILHQDWSAYWQTAQSARGIALDWSAMANFPDFYASLQEPLHAKTLISHSTPGEREHQLKLLGQTHPQLHTGVMMTIEGLVPSTKHLGLFETKTSPASTKAINPKPLR